MTRSEVDSVVELLIEGPGVERPRPSVKLRRRYHRRRSESGLGGKLLVREGSNPD